MQEENEKLQEENKRLKEIEENKSDLIFITTHQLRTSLSASKWILKMLIDGDAGKLNNEQKELIEKAYASNEHMLSLINNLINQNKNEKSKINYDFQKIDLIDLIDQTLFEFTGEIKKNNLDLIFLKPNKPLPLINCDSKMIQVVWQNLIENAIKYSNPGGKIFISIKDHNNEIQASIKDTGIGINTADKEKIFEKFFRAPNAVEKDENGTGLGLFTTKEIIKNHNGKIWFENPKEGGTIFYFTLPIS